MIKTIKYNIFWGVVNYTRIFAFRGRSWNLTPARDDCICHFLVLSCPSPSFIVYENLVVWKWEKKNYPCHLPRHLTVINLVQRISLQQAELVSSATSSISYMLYDITVHTAWCWKLEYYESSRLNFVTNKIISRHKQLFKAYFLTFTHVSINRGYLDEDTATEPKCCCQALHCMIRLLQNSHKYLSNTPTNAHIIVFNNLKFKLKHLKRSYMCRSHDHPQGAYFVPC